jgi:hypothetical protein
MLMVGQVQKSIHSVSDELVHQRKVIEVMY